MPLHQTLRQAGEAVGDRPLTLGDMFEMHGEATQGALLLMLAVPCLLPVPGAGTLMSLGLMAMATSLWRGHHSVGLPSRVAKLSMGPKWAKRVLNTLAWVYEQAGRWARRRWSVWVAPMHRHWVAVWVAAMAVLIALPIPFGNVMPAVALTLLGIGLIFRDGMLMLAGVAVGLLALAVTGWLGLWVWTTVGSDSGVQSVLEMGFHLGRTGLRIS